MTCDNNGESMIFSELSILLGLESIQITIVLLCILVNIITLRDAQRTRRNVLYSGADQKAITWTQITVRGRWCMLYAQFISYAMGLDRLFILLSHLPTGTPIRFFVFGALRVSMSVLIAWCTWINMRAYQGVRD